MSTSVSSLPERSRLLTAEYVRMQAIRGDLTSDGIYRSASTVLLNAEVRYRITKKWSFFVEG